MEYGISTDNLALRFLTFVLATAPRFERLLLTTCLILTRHVGRLSTETALEFNLLFVFFTCSLWSCICVVSRRVVLWVFVRVDDLAC